MARKKNIFIISKATALFWILLLFCMSPVDLLANPKAYRKNEQGNKLFQKEKYQEALKKYTEAQLSLPESLELHYNIGNVLYKEGRYDEAAGEYAQSIFSDRKDLKAYSYFNRGNAQFMQNDFQGAVDSYIESLKINPQDKDAKNNLELALQKLQESQEPSNQQKQDSSRTQRQKDQPKEKQETKKSPEQESSQEPPQKASPKTEKEHKDQSKQQREWQQMLLDAIEEQEKEALRKSLKQGLKEEEKVEKDW